MTTGRINQVSTLVLTNPVGAETRSRMAKMLVGQQANLNHHSQLSFNMIDTDHIRFIYL